MDIYHNEYFQNTKIQMLSTLNHNEVTEIDPCYTDITYVFKKMKVEILEFRKISFSFSSFNSNVKLLCDLLGGFGEVSLNLEIVLTTCSSFISITLLLQLKFYYEILTGQYSLIFCARVLTQLLVVLRTLSTYYILW